MKKYRFLSRLLLSSVLVFLFPTFVSANSSWCWISEQRPYDLLPLVMLLTLIIEVSAADQLTGVDQLPKTLSLVLIANILSFSAPYVLNYALSCPIYTFSQMLDHVPIFIVGSWYLLLTLAIEIPVVYLGIRKDAADRKKLIGVLVLSNLVTTLLVAALERFLCQGSW